MRILTLSIVAVTLACNASRDPLSLSSSEDFPGFSGPDGAGQTGGPGSASPGAAPAENPDPFTRRFYVSPNGNDGNDGTKDKPWRTIGQAVRKLRPGHAAVIGAGTYRELVDTTAGVSGTATQPIGLLAEPGAVAKLRPLSGASSTVRLTKGYWVLDGLEVDVAGAYAFAVRIDGTAAKGIVLRELHLYGGTAGAGVVAHGGASDLLIEGCRIHDFSKGDGTDDSHGVLVQGGVKGVRVLGNEIFACSGDSVQCQGQETVSSNPPGSNLLIEGNYFHDNRENAVDIKTCTDVAVTDNEIENFKPSSTSDGEAIVIHYAARRVNVRNNRIRNAAVGVSIGGTAREITVADNAIENGRDDSVGTRVEGASAVRIERNRFAKWGTGVHAGTWQTVRELTVVGNVFQSVATPLLIRDAPSYRAEGNTTDTGTM